MIGLQGMAAFAETVRHGSFAAAARELGLSPSAVAKSVARLEADLGLRLLHRTTREVSLTSDGHELYERCRRIVDEIDALRADAEGVRGEPSGTLRVSAPVVWGKKGLVPLLARLAARHPRLALEVALSDRYVDLIKEGFDAVVRVGHLRDSTLVARNFGAQQIIVCASPAYLTQQGRPTAPDQLGRHRCLLFRMPSTGRVRPWDFVVAGAPLAFTPKSTATFNDGEALVAAAAADMGLIQVPDYMAEDEMRAGRLVEILKSSRPPPMPLSVVYASSRQIPPRLRAFLGVITAKE